MATPAGDIAAVDRGAMPKAVSVLASAARTADPVASTSTGFGVPVESNAVHVIIIATASAATPSVVFNLEGYDPASGTWYTILASAAVTGAGTTHLRVWPGATPAANVTADDILPERVRVRPVHGDADSLTYSVGAIFSKT